MMWIFQDLIAVQREIYLAFAERIGEFAATGNWAPLSAFLPMGIVFGAVHALTPGTDLRGAGAKRGAATGCYWTVTSKTRAATAQATISSL